MRFYQRKWGQKWNFTTQNGDWVGFMGFYQFSWDFTQQNGNWTGFSWYDDDVP